MPVFTPTRLTVARKRRGLSKAALAEQVGISVRVLWDYESEKKQPTAKTLARIAEVLRFPIEFFHKPHLDEPTASASSFRSLSTLTATRQKQGLAAGALAFELAAWIDERFKLPEPNIPQYQGITPEVAASAVRDEWGLGERPVPNMIHLLEAHGVRVFSLSEECAELDAYSFWRENVPYVFLNTAKSTEHSRFDAAHELGHLVLHRKEVHGRSLEQEAQQFASTFLMPEGSVRAAAPRMGTLTEIIEAKRRWNVSAAALTYRLHQLNLISDWQYRALFIEMARNGYRTNEPNGSKPEGSQVLAKAFEAMRREGTTVADIARDLALPKDELAKLIFGLHKPALRLV